MKEARKHHFVPRSYLKYFSIEERVYVFDKETENKFIASIKDIAERHDYNRVESGRFIVKPPEDDPLFYEYKYNDLIEKRIPEILNNLISACTLTPDLSTCILTEKQKYDLAKMIVIQLLRTPVSRAYTFELGGPIAEKKLSQIREDLNQIFKEYNQIFDLQKRSQLIGVLDDFKYSQSFSDSAHLRTTTDEKRIEHFCKSLVLNHSWAIYRNDLYPCLPFVTSDHPVIMYNMENKHIGFGKNGLENISTVISMPLTPKYMVSLYHKDSFWGYYSQPYENKCTGVDDVEFIIKQVYFQLLQCNRQVYTTPDEKNQSVRLLNDLKKSTEK